MAKMDYLKKQLIFFIRNLDNYTKEFYKISTKCFAFAPVPSFIWGGNMCQVTTGKIIYLKKSENKFG